MLKYISVFILLFIPFVAQSENIKNDVVGGCNSNFLDLTDNTAVFVPDFIVNQYSCNSGKYLPADSESCAICPNGYVCNGGTFDFSETIAQGIVYDTLFNQNLNKACSENINYFIPTFIKNQYTCSSGYYLPADAESCATCPSGFICNGGIFEFDETKSQGIVYSNAINQNITNACSENMTVFESVFNPTQYYCAPGYYLGADDIECTLCPTNSYCPGGTYSFNETVPQGIEPCPEGTFAPMGSSICYEHILHIGDDVVYLKSTKLTTPSLNIGMDDGVFYANMTTVPTPMNSATERHLKIEYDNQIYYVCDDTTYNSD